MLKLEIADIFTDLYPNAYHLYCSISMRNTGGSVVCINGQWLAKVLYLKRVPENFCCISTYLSKYLQVKDFVELEAINYNFLPLERVLLEVISPIDANLRDFELSNYLLAGELVGSGCSFEFEYMGIIVEAKLKEADSRFGTISVNTCIEFCHIAFSDAYIRPNLFGTTLDVEEFENVGKTLLYELELFIQMEKEQPLITGCLIYGSSGTGKTSIACSILRQTGIYCKYVKCSDLMEADICLTFENFTAVFNHRGILVVDELEHLTNLQIQHHLHKLFLQSRVQSLFVVGITTNMSSLSHKLMSSDAFFTKIHLPLPNLESRSKILSHYLERGDFHQESHLEEFLASLSLQTQGFSPADIAGMIRQAIILNDSDNLTFETILSTAKETLPSNLTGLSTKIQKVSFKDLYGIDSILTQIRNEVVYPILNIDNILKLGISIAKGVLIYGPSGVGKTALALAIVQETGLSCIFIDGPSIRSQIVGQSEQAISSLFKKARSAAPCIILIDQIDMIISKRGTKNTSHGSGDRIITSFLTEMDGILSKDSVENIFIIAVTSRVEDVDPAVIRPGRLDVHIGISLPNKEARVSILRRTLDGMPSDLDPSEIEEIANTLDNCSSGDLINLCREAAMNSIRKGKLTVNRSDFPA